MDLVLGKVPWPPVEWVLDDDQWTVEGADDEDEETGFNIDPSFEEVPSGWLERTRRENILVWEARAWMKCVERFL